MTLPPGPVGGSVVDPARKVLDVLDEEGTVVSGVVVVDDEDFLTVVVVFFLTVVVVVFFFVVVVVFFLVAAFVGDAGTISAPMNTAPIRAVNTPRDRPRRAAPVEERGSSVSIVSP